jgi:hypothetical protein
MLLSRSSISVAVSRPEVRAEAARCTLLPRCGVMLGILLGIETIGLARAHGSYVGLLLLPPEGASRRRGGRLLGLNKGAVLGVPLAPRQRSS